MNMSCIIVQGHIVLAHTGKLHFFFHKFKSHFSEHTLKHCELSESYSKSVSLLNTSFISEGTISISEMPAKSSHNHNSKLQVLKKKNKKKKL